MVNCTERTGSSCGSAHFTDRSLDPIVKRYNSNVKENANAVCAKAKCILKVAQEAQRPPLREGPVEPEQDQSAGHGTASVVAGYRCRTSSGARS